MSKLYIPDTCTACIASLYLLVYKRKHPQTLGCISAYIRKIISIIFSYNMCHIFLTFLFHLLTSCFAYCFATIHNSIVSGEYPNSITIPCANSNMFHALNLLIRREIDKLQLTLPGFHAILTLGTLNINQACFDTLH